MKAIEFSQKLQYYSHLSGVRKTAFIIISVCNFKMHCTLMFAWLSLDYGCLKGQQAGLPFKFPQWWIAGLLIAHLVICIYIKSLILPFTINKLMSNLPIHLWIAQAYTCMYSSTQERNIWKIVKSFLKTQQTTITVCLMPFLKNWTYL